MSHFTYNEQIDGTMLLQGDILENTDSMQSVLKEIHSYFTMDRYSHFIILNQSCELQRRDGKGCNSKYIVLAAIRSLDTLLQRYTDDIMRTDIEKKFKICDSTGKEKFAMFVERLLNNEESEYFYLHSEPAGGLLIDSVAFLKVSFALKSNEHYGLCLDAKRLELKDPFGAKLGWLVGNMYSKVGTPDWVGNVYSNYEEFRTEVIRRIVDENIIICENNSFISELVKQYKGIDIDSIKLEDFVLSIDRIKKDNYDERFKKLWNGISSTLKNPNLGLKITDASLSTIKEKLEKDSRINALLRK